MATKRRPPDMSQKMRRIESAYGPPTPEDEKRVIMLLQEHAAMDLAPMLGLAGPHVTNSSSGRDSKTASQVVRPPSGHYTKGNGTAPRRA